MCGIAGIVEQRGTEVHSIVRGMVEAIRYRGPDDMGVWSDHAAGLALGHARFSILHLSPEGRQPMLSASGRHVISHNGKLCNFAQLCSGLESGMIFISKRRESRAANHSNSTSHPDRKLLS
jgi:asparagine synthase (glutamine-hydrolysing)